MLARLGDHRFLAMQNRGHLAFAVVSVRSSSAINLETAGLPIVIRSRMAAAQVFSFLPIE